MDIIYDYVAINTAYSRARIVFITRLELGRIFTAATVMKQYQSVTFFYTTPKKITTTSVDEAPRARFKKIARNFSYRSTRRSLWNCSFSYVRHFNYTYVPQASL